MARRIISINTNKLVYDEIDDEIIIINVDNGSYYDLSGSGADFWKIFQLGVTVDELIEQVSNHYNLKPNEIENPINQFLNELTSEELIELTESENTPEDLTACVSDMLSKKSFSLSELNKYTNMNDLLLLDPIHDVDEQGWPHAK